MPNAARVPLASCPGPTRNSEVGSGNLEEVLYGTSLRLKSSSEGTSEVIRKLGRMKWLTSGTAKFTAGVLVLLVLMVLIAILLWNSWLHPASTEETSNSETLRNVGLLIGGVVALVFAIWRASVAERQAAAAQGQANVARDNLLNDRYQLGAEMLGSSILSVRLGGIYALQQLAHEYPEQYHIQIVRLFCAFARNPTDKEEDEDWRYAEKAFPGRNPPTLREDVQAVIAALGSRSEIGRSLEEAQRLRLDFHGASLQGADLRRGTFDGANFHYANLIYADLSSANLKRAEFFHSILCRAGFGGANMEGVHLVDVNLSWADLQRATCKEANVSGDLSHVRLDGAEFSCARFGYADLSNAVLRGTNLTGATFSTAERGTITPFRDGSLARSAETLFVEIAQNQLDEAEMDTNHLLTIAHGMVDSQTGRPLEWRGIQLPAEAGSDLHNRPVDERENIAIPRRVSRQQ